MIRLSPTPGPTERLFTPTHLPGASLLDDVEAYQERLCSPTHQQPHLHQVSSCLPMSFPEGRPLELFFVHGNGLM